MADEVRFSVICPFYNAERYLEEAIWSVVRQTYKDWELILVDDGSADNSLQTAQKYASADSRIRVFTTAHTGTYDARMKGLSEAAGEYIVFLDSDDLLEETMLETVSGYLKDNTPDAIVFNLDRFGAAQRDSFDTDDIEQEEPLQGNRRILDRVFVQHSYGFALWRTVFCRRLIERLPDQRPASQRSAEDTYLAFGLFSAAQTALLLPTVLYHYRINPDSITQNADAADHAARDMTVLRIFEEIERRYPDLLAEGIGIHVVRSFFSYVIQVPLTTAGSCRAYRRHCIQLRESTFYNKYLKDHRTGDRKLDLCNQLFRRRMYTAIYVLLKVRKRFRKEDRS